VTLPVHIDYAGTVPDVGVQHVAIPMNLWADLCFLAGAGANAAPAIAKRAHEGILAAHPIVTFGRDAT
jgi:hypothetical protein